MNGIYKLSNPVKHYDWGSPESIPSLLNITNPEKKPYAEMWMGNMSLTDGTALDEIIKESPDFFLGPEVNRRYAGSLPYLFKLLAAEKPLSIQVHPNLEQANAGFARENARHIPLESAERTYKDANHKPEIICALTDYDALCGFRTKCEIQNMFRAFNCPALENFLELFNKDNKEDPLKLLMKKVFSLSDTIKEEIEIYIKENITNLCTLAPQYASVWNIINLFAQIYPHDAAIISPLYMNHIKLKPEEAIYLPAGVPHCYIHGFGVELMANSDNVIRGGLTAKFIDTKELFNIVNFHEFTPPIIKPDNTNVYAYKTEAKEFSLSVIQNTKETMRLPVLGPVILVVTRGTCTVSHAGGTLNLNQGESAFLAAGIENGNVELCGAFTVYAAGVP
ncbi:MAG: mannose-6-phosphate isomerase, class I [Spirochaetaceae bacterium]|nr:mannose-6-phosphate isomerase, class I [Spirochaetaceae bacterium]